MSEPTPHHPTGGDTGPDRDSGTDTDTGTGSAGDVTPVVGAVPEVTDPDTVDLAEPDLAEPVLSAEVEDEDVRGALAEAGEVEGEAQRASNEVGGEAGTSGAADTGTGGNLDVDPTSGPH